MKAKIFRKYVDNDLYTIWKELNPNYDYRQLIEEMKKDYFRQLIFSTEILVEVIKKLGDKKGSLLSMNFTDNVDCENQTLLKSVILNLRQGKIDTDGFLEELSWIIDTQSIDISSIDVLYNNERYVIYSNGIFEGENLKDIYEEILVESIKTVLT